MTKKHEPKFQYDNTLKVKILAECIEEANPEWWITKPGNDTIVFKKGDKVTTTAHSTFKPGIQLIVKDVDLVSGYARYLAGGVWHRAEDLVKAE